MKYEQLQIKSFALDIETIPNHDMIEYLPEPELKLGNLKDTVKIFEKKEEAKQKQIDTMALDPFFGRVACYSIVGEDFESEEMIVGFSDEDEELVVDTLLTEIRDIVSKGDRIVTWNGCSFDLPYIYKRACILGVEMPDRCPTISELTYRYSTHPHCDLMHLMNGYQGFGKLDTASKIILKNTGKIDFDVTKIADEIKNGNGDKVQEYCTRDTRITYQLFEKIQPYFFKNEKPLKGKK